MKSLLKFIPLISLLFLASTGLSYAKLYGANLCDQGKYSCISIDRGETWESLWPDIQERDVIQRLNRMNTQLTPGMRIAVPRGYKYMDLMDISPFDDEIEPLGQKQIIVDLSAQAWGAYNPNGDLLNWGPISGGKQYCPDVGRRCRTITGNFSMYSERGPRCVSKKYPIGRGGAPMPYCMFFYRGYAMHGSPVVPGYHASHGCIRLFTRDAKWINERFMDLPNKNNGYRGTPVKVQH